MAQSLAVTAAHVRHTATPDVGHGISAKKSVATSVLFPGLVAPANERGCVARNPEAMAAHVRHMATPAPGHGLSAHGPAVTTIAAIPL